MRLKRIVIFLGIVVLIHFLITGLFMKENFFIIKPEDTLVRMMYRANHIYILFSGLILLLVSNSIKKDVDENYLSILSITIIIIATTGINISFYIDPINHMELTTHLLQRKLTGFSIMGLLTGTGVHILYSWIKK
jgi:hypothetical protein